MDKISEIINDLSWHNDIALQKATIKLLLEKINDENITLLIQPGDDKSCWENAAIVLKELGYPRIRKVIPELLEWIEDLNWPGAEIVLNILARIDKEVLMPYVTSAKNKAVVENDEMWIDAIDQLMREIGSDST